MSVVLTDHRSSSAERPIWKAVWSQMSWTNGGGHTASAGTAVDINGYCDQLVAIISSATTDPDVVFTITEDSQTIYTSAAQNDGQTVVLNPDRRLAGNITVTADPDADPGASGLTVDIWLSGT